MPSAIVFPLAAHAATNRFTVRDRIELERWTEIAKQRGFDRLVLHERLESDPSDVGNYLAVYAEGCCWASCGLSRRPDGIVAWDSVSGLDLGRFHSMSDALSWVLERRADTVGRFSCSVARRDGSNEDVSARPLEALHFGRRSRS